MRGQASDSCFHLKPGEQHCVLFETSPPFQIQTFLIVTNSKSISTVSRGWHRAIANRNETSAWWLGLHLLKCHYMGSMNVLDKQTCFERKCTAELTRPGLVLLPGGRLSLFINSLRLNKKIVFADCLGLTSSEFLLLYFLILKSAFLY